MLIRLSQTNTRSDGSRFTGVKLNRGGYSDVACDPEQGAKCVEGVRGTIKVKRERVEVRLQVLWTDAVIEAP